MISELDPKKNDTFKGIPINLLKGSSDLCSSVLSEIWNDEIIHLKPCPNKFKLADVTPAFKKDDSTSVKNYRPVSVLPIVSKVFERIMINQINSYMDSFHLFTFFDSETALVLKQHFHDLLNNGKQYLTERDLVQLLWIYLRHLTQLIMNCC